MTLKLFEEESIYPEGFSYEPDFLSLDEENELLEYIFSLTINNFIFQGFEAKRKTINFGMDWSFEKRTLSEGKPFPDFFNSLVKKVAQYIEIAPEEFKELLVIEYPVGAVMNWHRDAPPFDKVIGISLLSDCTFRFRPYNKLQQNRKSIISLPVKRKSLYMMQSDSRSEWEHSVTPAKTKRYSITLRTLRNE